MTVKELELAIARLAPAELSELAAWFDEFHAEAWDRQIADDLRAGRLEAAICEAEEEVRAGRCKPL